MPGRVKHTFMLNLGNYYVFLGSSSPSKEPCDTLDAHVIALCCTTGEDNLFRISSDEVRYMCASFFHGLLRLPSICMCSRMWVAVQTGEERKHRVKDTGVC